MAEIIEAGGLEFLLENRGERADEDGGPSMQVLGTVDGNKIQLLRFDMFRINPHYHYAPTAQNLRYSLDPLTLDDGIGWAINLISNKLPQLLAKAGHEALATEATVAEVAKALPEIERRWRASVASPSHRNGDGLFEADT